MTTIKIKNTEANRTWLNDSVNSSINWSENGKFIEIKPSGYHAALLNSGQMSVASYKKNVLGL